jgi:hypothetical protein
MFTGRRALQCSSWTAVEVEEFRGAMPLEKTRELGIKLRMIWGTQRKLSSPGERHKP